MRFSSVRVLLILTAALTLACDEGTTALADSAVRTIIRGQVVDSWRTPVPGVELAAEAYPRCGATPATADPFPVGTSGQDGRFESLVRMPTGASGVWCLDLYAVPTAQSYLEADTVTGVEVEFRSEGIGLPADTAETVIQLESNAVTSADELELRMDVSPTSIEHQDSVFATIWITNPTDRTVELVSGCTALAFVQTFLGGQRIDLRGTVNGCFATLTPFRIGPGDTLTRIYEIHAVRADGEPAEPGTYELHVEFKVDGLAGLEDTFVIE